MNFIKRFFLKRKRKRLFLELETVKRIRHFAYIHEKPEEVKFFDALCENLNLKIQLIDTELGKC